MDKKEFAQFAMALKTYYPKENLLPNNQSMELWFRQLKDIPYMVAEAALNKWVATNKWSPSIAEVREQASLILNGEIDDWSAAWEDVMKAISRYGFYQIPAAMEYLEKNPIAHATVKRIGFRELCLMDNIDVYRANFRNIYESIAEREKKQAQLPASLTEKIGSIRSDNLMIGKDGEQNE